MSSVISDHLRSTSANTLLAVGIILIVVGALFLIFVICFRHRIAMGAKAVELGSLFIL